MGEEKLKLINAKLEYMNIWIYEYMNTWILKFNLVEQIKYEHERNKKLKLNLNLVGQSIAVILAVALNICFKIGYQSKCLDVNLFYGLIKY
jgi:hypothetical protein